MRGLSKIADLLTKKLSPKRRHILGKGPCRTTTSKKPNYNNAPVDGEEQSIRLNQVDKTSSGAVLFPHSTTLMCYDSFVSIVLGNGSRAVRCHPT